jgi:hypothetical protein
MNQPAPLTAFIIAMLKAEPGSLARADPEKLAAKYGIDPTHAAGYLRLHRR